MDEDKNNPNTQTLPPTTPEAAGVTPPTPPTAVGSMTPPSPENQPPANVVDLNQVKTDRQEAVNQAQQIVAEQAAQTAAPLTEADKGPAVQEAQNIMGLNPTPTPEPQPTPPGGASAPVPPVPEAPVQMPPTPAPEQPQPVVPPAEENKPAA